MTEETSRWLSIIQGTSRWLSVVEALAFYRPVNYYLPMNEINTTRQRLLDSARTLFYSRSYGHVGVKEICDCAGVQKGSFYHFFPSKQDLTLAALDTFFADMKEHLFAHAFRPELRPLARIAEFADNMYQSQKMQHEQGGKVLGCPYGSIAAELSTQDEVIREHINGIFRHIESEFQTVLDEAVRIGEIAPCDTAATATAMFSYLEGLLLQAKIRNDPEVIRQLGGAVLGIRIEEQALP